MSENKKGTLIKKQRAPLTLLFSAFVFTILLIAIILSAAVVFLIEAFVNSQATLDTWLVLLLMAGSSLVIGYGMVFLLSRYPLKPINMIINGMNSLAEGDFKTRLEFRGWLYNNSVFKEIEDSFNRMATELENTEMLRSDFINNFSHEFKTPIVSIAGFAKLLRRANLDEADRTQYLEVIEEESFRLASMATNILNLTKIENQTILGSTSRFNLSEQIRSSVLVLESKWSAKSIDFELDFGEYFINANEELLKEVWINLIDNAIKFSPKGGKVSVVIRDKGTHFAVGVKNDGEPIPEDKREKIFGKFYQADESHSGVGNGVGLAIVKSVVQLHRGDVEVICDGGTVEFEVSIPKTQSRGRKKK